MRTKRELRNEILKIRDSLAPEERQRKSLQIAKRVIQQEVFQEADKILMFSSYKSEVDTTEIFQAARSVSKDIYYPKVIGEEMEFYQVQNPAELIEGYSGIPEPEANLDKLFQPNPKEKVCIIIPGAVFDEKGNRIGYGGGYYDKFLQKLEAEIPKANLCKTAVAFECQIVEAGQIQSEVYDIKMDCIVNENREITILI